MAVQIAGVSRSPLVRRIGNHPPGFEPLYEVEGSGGCARRIGCGGERTARAGCSRRAHHQDRPVIILQAAATILVSVIAVAFLVDLVAERRHRHQPAQSELSELEVREHVYPAGNVHLIAPADEAEAVSPSGGKD